MNAAFTFYSKAAFILKRIMKASIFTLLFLGILFSAFQEPHTILPEEQEAFHAGNQYRLKKHRDSLSLDTFLCRLARKHSENMAHGKTKFGHDGFKERFKQISKELASNGAAENVYMSSDLASGEEAVDAWINSKDHRENLLGREYTRVGLGMASGPEGTFYTQIFSR